jgi:hypothetical protein
MATLANWFTFHSWAFIHEFLFILLFYDSLWFRGGS